MSAVDDDTPVASEATLASLRAIRSVLDAGVPEQRLIELTRMVGDASARLADATLRTFADALLQPGDSEIDLGLRIVDFGNALMPQVAVGFADMEGWTSLSERLEPADLSDVSQRFVDLAGEVAVAPVRLVKAIGDEAMLASEDPEALVGAALELVASAERDDLLPSLHARAALGDALRRAGDYYGRPVNPAARITAVAHAAACWRTHRCVTRPRRRSSGQRPAAGPSRASTARSSFTRRGAAEPRP